MTNFEDLLICHWRHMVGAHYYKPVGKTYIVQDDKTRTYDDCKLECMVCGHKTTLNEVTNWMLSAGLGLKQARDYIVELQAKIEERGE